MAGLLVHIINSELCGYGAYFDRFSLVSYFEIKNSVLLRFKTFYDPVGCVWPMPIWPFVFEKTLVVFLRFRLINYCHVIWCAAVNWSSSYFLRSTRTLRLKAFTFELTLYAEIHLFFFYIMILGKYYYYCHFPEPRQSQKKGSWYLFTTLSCFFLFTSTLAWFQFKRVGIKCRSVLPASPS